MTDTFSVIIYDAWPLKQGIQLIKALHLYSTFFKKILILKTSLKFLKFSNLYSLRLINGFFGQHA